MVTEHDIKNMEVKEFKDKIIEHFKSYKCFDCTLSFLLKEMDLSVEDLDRLEYCLGELVKEGWIEKSKSYDHYEYDPGEKLNYGGLKG